MKHLSGNSRVSEDLSSQILILVIITPKHGTDDGDCLRGLAPGQHHFEKRRGRGEPLATLCPTRPSPGIVHQILATKSVGREVFLGVGERRFLGEKSHGKW